MEQCWSGCLNVKIFIEKIKPNEKGRGSNELVPTVVVVIPLNCFHPVGGQSSFPSQQIHHKRSENVVESTQNFSPIEGACTQTSDCWTTKFQMTTSE